MRKQGSCLEKEIMQNLPSLTAYCLCMDRHSHEKYLVWKQSTADVCRVDKREGCGGSWGIASWVWWWAIASSEDDERLHTTAATLWEPARRRATTHDCSNALRTCKETCNYWPIHPQTSIVTDHHSTFSKLALPTVSLATCQMLEVTVWAWMEPGRWVSCQWCASLFIIQLEARLQPNVGFTLRRARCDGVHAFGYNFAGSEPIWVKCGALWKVSTGCHKNYIKLHVL